MWIANVTQSSTSQGSAPLRYKEPRSASLGQNKGKHRSDGAGVNGERSGLSLPNISTVAFIRANQKGESSSQLPSIWKSDPTLTQRVVARGRRQDPQHGRTGSWYGLTSHKTDTPPPRRCHILPFRILKTFFPHPPSSYPFLLLRLLLLLYARICETICKHGFRRRRSARHQHHPCSCRKSLPLAQQKKGNNPAPAKTRDAGSPTIIITRTAALLSSARCLPPRWEF